MKRKDFQKFLFAAAGLVVLAMRNILYATAVDATGRVAAGHPLRWAVTGVSLLAAVGIGLSWKEEALPKQGLNAGLGHLALALGIGTTVDGGFGEYCVVPQSQVYPFPDTVSFTQAAMTEPVACCLHGIEMCNIRSGDTVAVIGGGMIGLLMIQLARLQGAGTVILSEPVEAKREHGKKLGADIVIDPMAENLETALQARGITQINTVIECVGNPRTIEQAIAIAGKKATVMLFGLTKPDATVTVKPFALFKKELIVTASFINPYTQQRALNLITSGRLDVSSMIYKTISLEELPGVLADKGIRNAGKYIVTFP